jgi:hypothetical protein
LLGPRCEDDMTLTTDTITKVFEQAFPPASVEAEILKITAIFCGIGLLVSLGFAVYGLSLGKLIF